MNAAALATPPAFRRVETVTAVRLQKWCKRCKVMHRKTARELSSQGWVGDKRDGQRTSYMLDSTMLHCVGCRREMWLERIVARISEHVCGALCTNATGPNCECSCGGKNHGANR